MAGVVYDASFADADHVTTRPNHGKFWTKEHRATMFGMFEQGKSLADIVIALGRKGDSVLNNLVTANAVFRQDAPGGFKFTYAVNHMYFVRRRLSDPYLPSPQPEQETEMNPKEMSSSGSVIVTQTLIAGQNADLMSDDAIFALISKLENEAEKLACIRNKPKKLLARIERLSADVQKLVDFVDAR